MTTKSPHLHSINPKASFYFTNGTGTINNFILSKNIGRDTYISKQSTCVTLPKIKIHEPNTKLSFKYKNLHINIPNLIENKLVHYVSDGSGRDNYIKFNEGGQSHNYDCKKKAESYFENCLRTYNKCNTIQERDFFLKGQFLLSPIQQLKNKNTIKLQEKLIYRLSQPKFTNKKTLIV